MDARRALAVGRQGGPDGQELEIAGDRRDRRRGRLPGRRRHGARGSARRSRDAGRPKEQGAGLLPAGGTPQAKGHAPAPDRCEVMRRGARGRAAVDAQRRARPPRGPARLELDVVPRADPRGRTDAQADHGSARRSDPERPGQAARAPPQDPGLVARAVPPDTATRARALPRRRRWRTRLTSPHAATVAAGRSLPVTATSPARIRLIRQPQHAHGRPSHALGLQRCALVEHEGLPRDPGRQRREGEPIVRRSALRRRAGGPGNGEHGHGGDQRTRRRAPAPGVRAAGWTGRRGTPERPSVRRVPRAAARRRPSGTSRRRRGWRPSGRPCRSGPRGRRRSSPRAPSSPPARRGRG